MEVLLQARADPTLRDKQGCTPVHFASSCGHANMLETLLQYGGSSSTPDKRGFTPIHKAAYNGHDKCLEVLLEVGVVSGCGHCAREFVWSVGVASRLVLVGGGGGGGFVFISCWGGCDL